jgi:hypothetical protein
VNPSKQEVLDEFNRRGLSVNNDRPSIQELEAEITRRGLSSVSRPVSLSDALSNISREFGKNFLSQALEGLGGQTGIPKASEIGQKIGYGALPAIEQIPGGISQGLKSSYAALQGQPYQNQQAPNEYGASAGQSIGHGIGQGLAAAPIIAALRSGFGRMGLKSLPSTTAATAGGFAATEPGGIKERSLSGAEAAVIPLGFKALGALPDSILKNILGLKKPSEGALENAMKQLHNLTSEEKSLTSEASHKLGSKDPERLMLSAKEKQGQLSNALKEHETIKPENFETMLPDTRHETIIPKIKEQLEAATKEAKEYYQPNQNHGRRASTEIVDAIEGKLNKDTGERSGGIKQELGDLYDEFNKDLENKNVQIFQTPELKEIKIALERTFGQSTDLDKFNKDLLIKSFGSNKNINAKDYMTGYREILRQTQEAYKKAHSQGISPKAHDDWIKRAQELENTSGKMSSIIEEQLGGEHLEKLRAINKRYATEYAPLYKNPLYQEMLQHGRTSKNIAEHLSGTTSGTDILRNQVAKNPELQRLIVGQSLGKNLEGIKNPSENLTPYMQLNPKISETLQKHAATSQQLEHAEKIVPELEKIAKQRNEEFKLRQKEQDRRKTLEVEIPKLQYEIRESERLANAIKSKMNDKKLSKEEVDRLQKEYDRHIKNRDAIKNKLKGALYTTTVGAPLAYGLYQGKKYLNELFE